MKNKHVLFLAAGIATLALGFTILWQNISLAGPTVLVPNVCSSVYSIWLNNSKGEDSQTANPTKITFAASNRSNDNKIKTAVKFYSDSACTTEITSLTIAKGVSQGQFYVKFTPGELTGAQAFRISANASRFWAGASDITVPGSAVVNNIDVSEYGTWGINGNVNQKSIDAFKGKIDGIHLSLEWNELEPNALGVFEWKNLDDQIEAAVTNDLKVGVQLSVGPAAPDWMYCTNYDADKKIETPRIGKILPPAIDQNCVRRVFVSGQTEHQSPIFPYYFDAFYKERYYNVLHQMAYHMAAYAQTHPTWQQHIVYWQMAEGSTGDEGPYKGTLTAASKQYDISDKDWDDYKHAVWIDMYNLNKGLNPYIGMLINTGNNGANFDWMLANIPCASIKSGNLTHEYSFDGEINEYNRAAQLDASVSANGKSAACNRVRGEFQDVYDASTWDKSNMANSFAISLSAVTMGLDMFNLTGASVTSRNSTDLSIYDIFDKYAGVRQAKDINKAFIGFRDVPDFMDTVRFPVSTYGSLFKDQTVYDNKIRGVDANTSAGAERLTAIREDEFNTDRGFAIRDSFATNAAYVNKPKWASIEEGRLYGNVLGYNIYDHDFGIDMLRDNYGVFMKQVDPNGTSIGQWRIHSDEQYHTKFGRYARSFDAANGKTEMIFNIDDTLDNSVGVKNLKVSVTYYDVGTNKWSLNYTTTANGTVATVPMTNTNTGGWVTKSWILPSVNLLNKYQGKGDLSLKYVSGGNTIFALLEVETTTEAASFAATTVEQSSATTETTRTASSGAVPVITSGLSTSKTVGTTANYRVRATNNPTSFSASGLPPGIGIDSATGTLTGTLTTAGTYSVTISATNSAGTGSAVLNIKVK